MIVSHCLLEEQMAFVLTVFMLTMKKYWLAKITICQTFNLTKLINMKRLFALKISCGRHLSQFKMDKLLNRYAKVNLTL